MCMSLGEVFDSASSYVPKGQSHVKVLVLVKSGSKKYACGQPGFLWL